MLSLLCLFIACITAPLLQQLSAQTDQYIVIDQWKDYSEAQAYCQSQYSTDLASIHSDQDNNAAKALCYASGESCWIGLDDILGEALFAWKDGTEFDYGSNISGGVYPWDGASQPEPNNYDNADCVELARERDYGWNDDGCHETKHFICNAQALDPTSSPTQSTGSPTLTPSSNTANSAATSSSIWSTIALCALAVVSVCGIGFAFYLYRKNKKNDRVQDKVERPVQPDPDTEQMYDSKLRIETESGCTPGPTPCPPPKLRNRLGDDEDKSDTDQMYSPNLKIESEQTTRTRVRRNDDDDDDVKLDVSLYKAWSSDNVVRWIVGLNYEAHKQYETRLRTVFTADIVNGKALIGVTAEYLKECGVGTVHRQTILQNIQKVIRMYGGAAEPEPKLEEGGEGEVNEGGEAQEHGEVANQTTQGLATNNIDPELGVYEAKHMVDL